LLALLPFRKELGVLNQALQQPVWEPLRDLIETPNEVEPGLCLVQAFVSDGSLGGQAGAGLGTSLMQSSSRTMSSSLPGSRPNFSL
jgi:hypothetical protein